MGPRKERHPYHGPWKGDCQHFNVRTSEKTRADRAWSYPEPIPASFGVVGQDYSNYVAFAPDVDVD